MPSPKVFITNFNDQHDYGKADRFGKVIQVTTGPVNIYRPQRTLITMCENLKNITEQDYILFSGNALSGLLIIVAIMHRVRIINLLVFNAREDDYICHKIDLSSTRITQVLEDIEKDSNT